jgi:hypothetical protein
MLERKGIFCQECGKVPDEILILNCNHNLCLNCAAKNLQHEELVGNHKFQVKSLNIPLNDGILDYCL